MTLNYTQKLLAGALALVLVAGMTSPAFAGASCEVDPLSQEISLPQDGDVTTQKTFDCDDVITEIQWASPECTAAGISVTPFLEEKTTPQKWIVNEKFIDNGAAQGSTECSVQITVHFEQNQPFTVVQDNTVNLISLVAGELLPLDSTALLIGGLTSMSVWMIPAVAGIAGAGIYLVKFRANRD